jgi:hypothetical protein
MSSMSAPGSPTSPAEVLPSTSRDSGIHHGSDEGSAGEARISRLKARIRAPFLEPHTPPKEHSGTLDRAFSRAKVWGKRKGKRKNRVDETMPRDSTGSGAVDGASRKSGSSGSGSGSGELTYSVSRSASCSSAEARSRPRSPVRSFASNSPADHSPVSLIAGGRRGLPRAGRNSSASAGASSGEEPTQNSDRSNRGYPEVNKIDLQFDWILLTAYQSLLGSLLRGKGNTKTNARPLPVKHTPSPEQRSRVSTLDSSDSAPLDHLPRQSLEEATQAKVSSKYGEWGKVLGSGVVRSVRLYKGKLKDGGKTYAAKQFRPRKPRESEEEYRKRVTAEFRVCSALKHSNIIETVEIFRDNGRFYQVSRIPVISLTKTHIFPR